MIEGLQATAAIIFNASAIMMAIALVLITSCWKTLKEVLSTLPPKQRNIVFNLRHLESERNKLKEELKSSLYSGVFFLGCMILCNVTSLLCASRTMLDFKGPPIDFAIARYAVTAGVTFLFLSIFCLGYYRIWEFIGLRQGKGEPIKALTETTSNKKQRKFRKSGNR